MKFTKGTWSVDDGAIIATVNDSSVSIANVYGADDFPHIDPDDHDMNAVIEECKANAQLLAAAPELLKACQAFVTAYEKSLQLEKTDVALRLAKAAIEKATIQGVQVAP